MKRKLRNVTEEKTVNDKMAGLKTEEAVETKTADAFDEIEKEQEKEADLSAEQTVRKRKKWPFFTLAGVILALTAAYFGVAFYYSFHFLPGTFINGIDCSGSKAAPAAERLDARLGEYSLTVTGRDPKTGASGTILGTITASDIGLSYLEAQKSMERLLKKQSSFLWPKSFISGENSLSDSANLLPGITYDEGTLAVIVKNWDSMQAGNMTKAENAYIKKAEGQPASYEIVPETFGTETDVDQVVQTVASAVDTHELSVDLEEKGLYKTAEITSEDAKLQETVNTANQWLGTEITYDWNGEQTILDGKTLADWISIDGGKAVLDEEAVKAFVKEQADQHDTYGKSKKFVTALGVELSLRSPNYGWRTDVDNETKELISLIKKGTVGKREPVYLNQGVQKGKNDIGDSYVEADLTHQHLYVVQDGEIVLETDFVSGNVSAGNQTPQGIFALTYKTRNAVLRGQNYETPVNYWMPFYGNYGMHDATWRAVFGGEIYLTNGSHGCINLPLAMAAQIYEYVYTGSPVICYYYPAPVNPEPLPQPQPEVPQPQPEVPQPQPEAPQPESAE